MRLCRFVMMPAHFRSVLGVPLLKCRSALADLSQRIASLEVREVRHCALREVPILVVPAKEFRVWYAPLV